MSLLGEGRRAHLPAAEWEYHMKLMLHPPQLHHCLGLKAKGGKRWVSVRDQCGEAQGDGETTQCCTKCLLTLQQEFSVEAGMGKSDDLKKCA